jgi:diguanylate cyclase (GGDEF)-like protein/PAS domain S-box-containing protein
MIEVAILSISLATITYLAVSSFRLQREKTSELIHELEASNIEQQHSLEKEQTCLAKLSEQHYFLNAFLDMVPIPIFYKDGQGIYQNANSAFYEAVGLQPEEIIGKTTADTSYMHVLETTEKADKALLETGEKQEYETQILFKDGLRHQVIVNKAVLRNDKGEITGIIGSITDITERKINEAKIQYTALHDQLTGLSNRNMFFKYLGAALAKAKRYGGSLALLYIDLDGFKAVNDELGHDAGDAVLKVVSNRLKSHTRESDTVCRLGGDEFAILVEQTKGRADLVNIAGKIIQAISETITTGGHKCSVSASVGIAVYPDHASELDILLKKADTAMYEAKRQGRGGYCIYGE